MFRFLVAALVASAAAAGPAAPAQAAAPSDSLVKPARANLVVRAHGSPAASHAHTRAAF